MNMTLNSSDNVIKYKLSTSMTFDAKRNYMLNLVAFEVLQFIN